MNSFQWFLFVYVFGGLTFIPLVIAGLLAIIYYTSTPLSDLPPSRPDDPANLVHSDDEKTVLKTNTDDLAEKFQRKHESDVAAGYFAVCREYVPGGVNGKPPEKNTPAGEVVAQESPSVYQSMYRSIFDRSQRPTIEPNKDGAGKTTKKANNIFYIVLRHNHLMLYDDATQLEVRYVISLEYHDVDVYGGGEEITEAELWTKRNAIRLRRKPLQIGDKAMSQPFFLFSENLSDKEDFYFALLKNQHNNLNHDIPVPQEFDSRHMVNLIKQLHSSEEHLQTRWLNALVGRLFLAMYKTPDLENLIRMKLTKKISRVKKPNFITRLVLQKIEAGVSAPYITNPRLKDMTTNGDCIIEADIDYAGNFRIELAATARLDLGSHFKAREVDLVMAATAKKLAGHLLIRFKPPPSNRIWFTFEKMPQLDLHLEPIISSRQITYNVILRAIESRIREVVAETVVLPFWDDMPFLDTKTENYRGGIWKKAHPAINTIPIRDEVAEDEAEAGGSGASTPLEVHPLKKEDRTMSSPLLTDAKILKKTNVTPKKAASTFDEILGTTAQNTSQSGSISPPPPRLMRSTSMASAADPMVTASHMDGDAITKDYNSVTSVESAAAVLKDLSKRGTSVSLPGSQGATPPKESVITTAMEARNNSVSSPRLPLDRTPSGSRTPSLLHASKDDLARDSDQLSVRSGSIADSLPDSIDETLHRTNTQGSKMSLTDRKQAMASINAGVAAAQKWGWGVLQRAKQKGEDFQDKENASLHVPTARSIPTEPMGRGRPLPPPGTPLPFPDNHSHHAPAARNIPTEPMGRGRPLPPPGIPLPPPDRNSKTAQATKRKALPPPLLPQRTDSADSMESGLPKPSPVPSVPERRDRKSSIQAEDDKNDELLVVAAPQDSTPGSPSLDEHRDDFFGHGEQLVNKAAHTDVIQPPPPAIIRTPPPFPETRAAPPLLPVRNPSPIPSARIPPPVPARTPSPPPVPARAPSPPPAVSDPTSVLTPRRPAPPLPRRTTNTSEKDLKTDHEEKSPAATPARSISNNPWQDQLGEQELD